MKTEETKEDRIKRWAKSDVAIYVVTENLNWGKGANLPEALKNAKWKKGQKLAIELYVCSPNDLDILENGIRRPQNTKVYSLTNWEGMKI